MIRSKWKNGENFSNAYIVLQEPIIFAIIISPKCIDSDILHIEEFVS